MLSIGPSEWVRRTDEAGNLIATGTGLDADTVTGIMYYDIANDAGVELPNSGGPGTTWLYLLGAGLLLGCGITLIARRRIRTSLQ